MSLLGGAPPQTAIELARQLGMERSKDVNSVLYQLEKGGKIQKTGMRGAKPLWALS